MNAPNTDINVLPFEDRLQLVSDEVIRRVNLAKPTAKTTLQAQLWVRWLNREVLS